MTLLESSNSLNSPEKPGVYLETIAAPVILVLVTLVARMSLVPYWKNLPLSGDEIYYWDCARSVAKGHFINNFLHPPLWGFVLGIPAAISQDPFAGRVFTVMISSISVAIIYLLGSLIFGRKTGLIAAVIYSAYPNIVGFSHYLWPESLLSLLVLLAALLFFKWLGNEAKRALLYVAFLALGAGMLVKEFALIAFGAMLFTIMVLAVENKRQIIVRSSLMFLAPVLMYSIFASVAAKRPVLLADAFVFNSNEADEGKVVWERSTRENLKAFAGRALEIKKMPERFVGQLLNLWTPTSFPIFRLLKSMEGYRGVPHAWLIAYLSAAAYVLVVGMGIAGMCFARRDALFGFSAANLILLSSAGFMFMMCSRFRISFMYIFILYFAAALADFESIKARINRHRVMALAALLMLFAGIILLKRSSFGYWG
jgi:4-amino-4-deoxy-L-arabinose transferase-like glycosyltransferase